MTRSISKINKSLSNFIPIHKIPNILKEEDIDIVIDEVVHDKDFQKSDTEIETYESIEEFKYPQEHEDGGIIILDDLMRKKGTILECKLCLRDRGIIIFLYS